MAPLFQRWDATKPWLPHTHTHPVQIETCKVTQNVHIPHMAKEKVGLVLPDKLGHIAQDSSSLCNPVQAHTSTHACHACTNAHTQTTHCTIPEFLQLERLWFVGRHNLTAKDGRKASFITHFSCCTRY